MTSFVASEKVWRVAKLCAHSALWPLFAVGRPSIAPEKLLRGDAVAGTLFDLLGAASDGAAGKRPMATIQASFANAPSSSTPC